MARATTSVVTAEDLMRALEPGALELSPTAMGALWAPLFQGAEEDDQGAPPAIEQVVLDLREQVANYRRIAARAVDGSAQALRAVAQQGTSVVKKLRAVAGLDTVPNGDGSDSDSDSGSDSDVGGGVAAVPARAALDPVATHALLLRIVAMSETAELQATCVEDVGTNLHRELAAAAAEFSPIETYARTVTVPQHRAAAEIANRAGAMRNWMLEHATWFVAQAQDAESESRHLMAAERARAARDEAAKAAAQRTDSNVWAARVVKAIIAATYPDAEPVDASAVSHAKYEPVVVPPPQALVAPDSTVDAVEHAEDVMDAMHFESEEMRFIDALVPAMDGAALANVWA
jgi:hypothetical protein